MINSKYFLLLSLLLVVVEAKLNCDCQPNLDDRIINGERTGEHEFPWQLSLGLRRGSQVHHICGATLLNEEWVVTASHCVFGFDNEEDYSIGYGSNDLKQMTKSDRITARKIFIHPEYTGASASSRGDIALIQLSRPVELNTFVKPACLIKDLLEVNTILADREREYTATGFGSVTRTYKWLVGGMRGGKIERYMKKAQFTAQQPGEKTRDCRNRNDLICIEPVRKGDSVCNGDSGGPLAVVVTEDDSLENTDNNSTTAVSNRMSVIGVTSFGSGDLSITGYVTFCNGMAAYTKIAYFNSFILEHIEEDNLCMI